MKVTKDTLKRIIKEEYERMVGEADTGSVTPEDGKYYMFKSGDQEQFTNCGKYVSGKGFIKVEHEDFYKRHSMEPWYDKGTAVKEVSPEEAAKIAAKNIAHAEAVEKYSIRND